MDNLWIYLASLAASLAVIYYWIKRNSPSSPNHDKWSTLEVHIQQLLSQRESIDQLLKNQQQDNQQARQRFDEHQINSLKLIQNSMQSATDSVLKQVHHSLTQHGAELGKRFDELTTQTDKRLKEISREVETRLQTGFEKTTATFTDIIKRLAIIDSAQQKITELSTNVVSLQEILTDKRSRGAFGEVQLSSLIHNVIPESHFSLQHTLSNGKRVDCMLFLPEPSGHIAIDAKFPLEGYQKIHNAQLTEAQRKMMETQFKQDIKKHIKDIADKYIIPNETADGAMMFIPAEAIFAYIHAEHPDLVALAQRQHVWLVSPTTMMAILTTAKAVIKDAATRKQVHIIQEHLVALSKDFSRFQSRMDNLAKHIGQAQQDVDQVHRSSQKISQRFNKIEQVELESENPIEIDS